MKKLVLAATAVLSLAAAAEAATYTIGTDQGLVSAGRDNQGWWRADASNSNGSNDNYITGEYSSNEFRSYFTFDLSSIAGETVTGATIELRRYNQSGTPTLEFFDVSTTAQDLAQRNTVSAAIFDDLGTGSSYGTFTPASGNSTDVLSFVLNSAALSDITASLGGYFSVGATASGGLMFAASGGEPGNNGSGFTQQLVLATSPVAATAPVPLPAPVALLAGGVACMAVVRRRKPKA